MLVFEAAGDAPLVLAGVDSKAQLPFEDLLVVVGRLDDPSAAGADTGDVSLDPPRQFTGVGARVKADGKRRLAVFPLPSAQTSMADEPFVQVLEVGEGAALFMQDTRACFPSLVKKNPLAFATDSDEDDSDSSDTEEEEAEKKTQDEPKKKQRKTQDEDEKIERDTLIDADTRAFMAKTHVKVLPTLDELFRAYQIANVDRVRAAIARDRRIATDSQLLCVELPAPSSPVPAAVSSGETKLGFGVLFCHAAIGGRHAALLRVPLPRSIRLSSHDAGGGEEEDVSFQDATVLSFGTHRESTRHGGGKTSDEMVQNIRMRHASGTFCTLVLPSTDWARVVGKHGRAVPQLRGLHGELRLRRFMGPAKNDEPVELQLEM